MESQVDPKYLESTASRPNEQKRDIKSIEPLSGRDATDKKINNSIHNKIPTLIKSTVFMC